MYITKCADKITPFGGINFCLDSFHSSGLAGVIDRQLGDRGGATGFSYSEIMGNLMGVFFAGGDCAEDLAAHLSGPLGEVKGMALCSPDTLLRGIKELACPSQELAGSDSGVTHQFNINAPLNDLLAGALRRTGQLEAGKPYDLDYDNQVIPTEKWDAAPTYKKRAGYQPAVASIDNMPVYIEGRGGNSPAKYKQAETLQRVFTHLKDQQVTIGRFRADSASYQKNVVTVVEDNSATFYIRAKRSAGMEEQIGQLPEENWKPVRLGAQQMEVAGLDDWRPFGGARSYRLVVSRIPRDDRQTDVFSGQAYTWRATLTNDTDRAAEDIIAFYNERGNSERLFDIMNNDFGWSRLPCSFLSENTAFMILSAIIANFYRYIISTYSESIRWLKATFRLKKFIFRFITVPAKWIRTGRRHVLKLYTAKDYHPLVE